MDSAENYVKEAIRRLEVLRRDIQAMDLALRKGDKGRYEKLKKGAKQHLKYVRQELSDANSAL
ncbi:hypothetical protein GOV11_00665 [Candidatus Woesearchaeota archaeon]|nr:hypothetical protein [Candidatus Woesearchaeota archaeon]